MLICLYYNIYYVMLNINEIMVYMVMDIGPYMLVFIFQMLSVFSFYIHY